MSKVKVIISGGGTGGHIFPAIAIADAIKLQYKESEILFVGARNRMEMERVPMAGYKIEGLNIAGIQRTLSFKNCLLPFKIMVSLVKAWRIVKDFRPNIAIGVGGYASGPLLLVAARQKVPTLIQEQNSFAGKTNQWLASSVDKICVAYKKMDRFFPEEKMVLTGNPVRQKIKGFHVDALTAKKSLGLDADKLTLFAFGGSLGARTINDSIVSNQQDLTSLGLQIVLQSGANSYEKVKSSIAEKHQHDITVKPFIDDMDVVYAAADMIVCRSGALSIAELCLVGKPVIFIPSPYVAEDHQTHNALALVDEGAALMLKDQKAVQEIVPMVEKLVNNATERQKLGETIKQMAMPNATAHILKEIDGLLNKNKS